ncbi:MFS transporter [Limosilactobacillus caccae]|uniref:MFS transporter n=1 Tax=Limosilactobacillus caccae TaxID=1926284 RepID=UPI0009702D27|nr:MFS transporter [Limosilactobacillus caccae]
MKVNKNLVIAIGSVINCLFIIGLIIFDKYWDTTLSWLFVPYILLMTSSAAMLIFYATKNRK